jgi:hypothetical protein
VDIDPQAVEVTQLSLYLKLLEEETIASTHGYQMEMHSTILPSLEKNVVRGNSLISRDTVFDQLFTVEEEKETCPINFEYAFPEVMRRGGFDAVVGNPPYIRIQTMQEWTPRSIAYFKRKYRAASKGNYDIYVVFVERGLSLLNERGRLGYILPHKFLNAQYGEPLRGLLAEGRHLTAIVHFGDQQVFDGATTYTCLLFLDKRSRKKARLSEVKNLDVWRKDGTSVNGSITNDKLTGDQWTFSAGPEAALFERLAGAGTPRLGEVAHIFVGTQTSADDVYVLQECEKRGPILTGYSTTLGKRVTVETDATTLFLRGKEIRRYEQPCGRGRMICPYEITATSCRLRSEAEMRSRFPKALKYLSANKAVLTRREKGKFSGSNWFAFGYPKSMTLFQKPKIIVPDYNDVASFTFDDAGHFYKTGYGVLIRRNDLSAQYVLGLLNSKLLFRFLLSIGTVLRGGYVRFWTQFIEQLPIRPINLTDPTDKARHDKMVSLVEQMLAAKKQQSAAKTDKDRNFYERKCEHLDKQIDALVYALYGLTAEEIRIVEGPNA